MYQEASRTMDMFGQMRTLLAMKGMMPPDMMKKPSKNGPCPCGSGKKYKRCCGKGK
ncbi:MAG: SEC-C domain-containing protein [Oscillospiraceae bacterium]|nr:SEC-C domain-containing protein [Oscillospiraceae bacterium]